MVQTFKLHEDPPVQKLGFFPSFRYEPVGKVQCI